MIYICIPSHNEERTVGILLWKIRQVLTAFPRDYQLLVLDDASDDRTPEVLSPYARILPLTVLRHERRKGYAASLDELIREAVRRSEYPRRDVVLTLQADFSEEPDEIPALLKRIESGADIVTTRARIAPEHAGRKVRWLRALMLRVLRRLSWPENVTDMLSGLRAYRVLGLRKALEARDGIRLVDWHDAWTANAALLRAVAPYVRRVDEVEVVLRPDRLQRPSRLDPWATAREVARLAFGRRSGTPVPEREGGAIVVSAEELAAAGRELRPAEEPPPRRGRGGVRARSAAAAPGRRGAREAEPGQAPGRRRKGGEAERPERAAGKAERAGRAQASERQEHPDRPERAPRPERAGRRGGRAEAPAPEVVETVDASAASAPPVPGKSRRRRRGAAAQAEAPAGGPPLPLEGEAAPELTAPMAASPEQGDVQLAQAPEGASEGAGEAPAGERKRRRRSSRRGRRRGAGAGAAEANGGEGDAGQAGADELPEAAGDQLELGGISELMPDAEPAGAADGEGTEAGAQGTARPRRRSRRGGRGRSRRRSTGEAGGEAGGEPQPAAPGGEGGESRPFALLAPPRPDGGAPPRPEGESSPPSPAVQSASPSPAVHAAPAAPAVHAEPPVQAAPAGPAVRERGSESSYPAEPVAPAALPVREPPVPGGEGPAGQG